jgi:hypothetical protein
MVKALHRQLVVRIGAQVDAHSESAIQPRIGRGRAPGTRPRRERVRRRGDTDDYVEEAIKARVPAGKRCKVRSSDAMAPDPEVTAANRLRTRAVQIVDMTRFICDARWCYPVIGGALVFKDQNHLTEVFGRTLGPYLSRAIDG